MIRTTISRIKRVWAITFCPRLLRGDLRYPSGKFQILTSTAPTTSLIRTKSNDSIYENSKNRVKYGVASAHEEKDVFDDYMPKDMLGKDTRHGAPQLYTTTSACRCDECNRVIAEIFGEEPAPSQKENNLKTKVLANIAQVNMTDTTDSDKIVTDSRIHGGLFNNLNKSDNDSLPEKKKQEVDSDSINMTKDNYRSVLCHEVVLMNNKKGNKSEPTDVDTHQMYTNLYDVDPEEYQLKCSHDEKSTLSDKKSERKVDAYWNEVYETAVGENSVYCEPTLSIDSDTLNTYKALKRGDSEVKDKDASLGVRQMKYSPREIEKMYETSLPADKSDAVGMIIKAEQLDDEQLTGKASTTAQDEDKLTQKIEHIEETPLVEAEKPKVEGTQGTPRILGCTKAAVELNTLDEVAKRCLTTHHNQIDEILLKEMEKLGIPLTVQKSARGLKMGDIQTDASIEPNKTTPDIETELDNHDFDSTHPSSRALNKSNNLNELIEIEANPLKLDNQYYFDLHGTKIAEDFKNKQLANLEPTTETNVSNESNERKFGWLYWRADNDGQPWSKRRGTSEQENNTNYTNNIWQKNQLDPKHVLTCNETCSISPKPLVSTDDMNHIEGTEVMFEQKNIQRYEYEKQEPLLEDGCSNPYVTRSETNPREYLQCAKTSDYINVSKAEDFTDFINSTNSTIMTTRKTGELAHTKDYINLVGISHEVPIGESTRGQTEDSEVTLDCSKDIRKEPNVIETTNEQLQVTSEQLQAASMQLQATCVHLQNTTEKLQETTEQLQATSDNLLDSSDKLHAASGNLYTTTEKLQYSSDKLRDTSEQLGFDMQMLFNKVGSYPTQAPKEQMWDTNEEAERADELYHEYMKMAPSTNSNVSSNTTADKNELLKSKNPSVNSTTPIINTSITTSINPNYKPTIIPCVTPATASIIAETVNSLYRMKSNPIETKQTESKDIQDIENIKTDDEKQIIQEIPTKAVDPKIEGWAHQATTINAIPITENLPSVKPLPEMNERVKLSELMRLVRERNRLVDCHEAHVLAKPPRKDIPPMARPMAHPPDFKMPSYPQIKAIPRICVPNRKKPNTKSMKCSRCDVETLGLDQHGPLIAQNESEGLAVFDQQQPIDITFLEDDFATDLTEEFILQLHSLGNDLESSFQRGKTEILEAAVVAKTNHLTNIFRSKDYDPWSPIPSWPYPKKYVRPKLRCPKDGCKVPPPRLLEDRPCGLKPCESFPTFPKRTLSLLDCYPVSLGDHKVVDVGKF